MLKIKGAHGCRRAFSIIELLIVLSVMALLISLAIPAIQIAYGSAMVMRCQANLKELGESTLSFVATNESYPSSIRARLTGPLLTEPKVVLHNYWSDLIPYLNEPALSSLYNTEVDFAAGANSTAVGLSIPAALCPAVPNRAIAQVTEVTIGEDLRRLARGDPSVEAIAVSLDSHYHPTLRGAATDYTAIAGVSASTTRKLGYQGPVDLKGKDVAIPIPGMFPPPTEQWEEFRVRLAELVKRPLSYEFADRVSTAELVDGASHTLLFVETAGRPSRWIGNMEARDRSVGGAEWAHPKNLLLLDGGDTGRCLVQCDNATGFYSFHAAGVNVVFADGHVETISRDVDALIVMRFVNPYDADPRIKRMLEIAE